MGFSIPVRSGATEGSMLAPGSCLGDNMRVRVRMDFRGCTGEFIVQKYTDLVVVGLRAKPLALNPNP